MLSYQQVYEKKLRIKKVIDTFLTHNDISITELSRIVNVPRSTIQRDLNDIEYIQMIYIDKSKDILKQISEKLKKNKEQGVSIGGINSTTTYEPIRDKNGRFIGNKKR